MESTSRESLGGEKMEATFSKKENTRKAKTKKAEKFQFNGFLKVGIQKTIPLFGNAFHC